MSTLEIKGSLLEPTVDLWTPNVLSPVSTPPAIRGLDKKRIAELTALLPPPQYDTFSLKTKQLSREEIEISSTESTLEIPFTLSIPSEEEEAPIEEILEESIVEEKEWKKTSAPIASHKKSDGTKVLRVMRSVITFQKSTNS